MEIQITSRHTKTKVSQELHDAITAEVGKLEKFYDGINTCRVVLDNESTDKTKTVEITMHVRGNHEVVGLAKAENIGKAIDEAVEKAERQLKKLNEKVKSHK